MHRSVRDAGHRWMATTVHPPGGPPDSTLPPAGYQTPAREPMPRKLLTRRVPSSMHQPDMLCDRPASRMGTQWATGDGSARPGWVAHRRQRSCPSTLTLPPQRSTPQRTQDPSRRLPPAALRPAVLGSPARPGEHTRRDRRGTRDAARSSRGWACARAHRGGRSQPRGRSDRRTRQTDSPQGTRYTYVARARRKPRRGGSALLPRRLDGGVRRRRQVFSADATLGRGWARGRAPRAASNAATPSTAGLRREGVLRRPGGERDGEGGSEEAKARTRTKGKGTGVGTAAEAAFDAYGRLRGRGQASGQGRVFENAHGGFGERGSPPRMQVRHNVRVRGRAPPALSARTEHASPGMCRTSTSRVR